MVHPSKFWQVLVKTECRQVDENDSQGSLCHWVWGPATCWRTGSGWGSPTADEQTRSSSRLPPEGHTAALHHWSCPSLWLRPEQMDITHCVSDFTRHKSRHQHCFIKPHMYKHTSHVNIYKQAYKLLSSHTHIHTYRCCLFDELSNQVFQAGCRAFRLEMNLNAGLIGAFYTWKEQKHSQKMRTENKKITIKIMVCREIALGWHKSLSKILTLQISRVKTPDRLWLSTTLSLLLLFASTKYLLGCSGPHLPP